MGTINVAEMDVFISVENDDCLKYSPIVAYSEKQIMSSSTMTATARGLGWTSGHVVVIHAGMSESLSQEELSALLHHEVAHLQLGHPDKVADDAQVIMTASGLKVVLSDRFETEADAFAIERVGLQPLRRAIGKMVKWMHENAGYSEQGWELNQVAYEILKNTPLRAAQLGVPLS